EEVAPPGADVAAGQGTDRLTAVADRGPQRAEVVHPGEEDGPEGHPQEGGQPAPDDGDGRTDDRCGAGHGGEVVAPEDVLVRRDVVDAVLELVRGRGSGVIEDEDLPGEVPRVQEVAGDDHHHTDACEQQRVHFALPSTVTCI